MSKELIEDIDKLHSTEMGLERIRSNLDLGQVDPVAWCREAILEEKAVITRKGKNWYVRIRGCVITVNAGSLTIITAHKEK